MRMWMLFLLLLPACVFARDWQVDMTKSSLTFTGTYQDGPFTGKFGRFQANISFDEGDLVHSRFDVTIDMASVNTQSSERDQTLGTADFFDTGKFPQAHFVTTSFERDVDGNLLAHGPLTIRDRFRPVTLKVDFAISGGATNLDVDTVLNRLDFDLGSAGQWSDIGRDVHVHGHLVLTAKP